MSPRVFIESGPSLAGRLVTLATYAAVRVPLMVGSHAIHLPWPKGMLELYASLLPKPWGTRFERVELPQCSAQLVHGRGVTPDSPRVILYCHGGGFMVCGPHTHTGITTRLSRSADCPVLVVDYRKIPGHSIADAVDDCVDGYRRLREEYEADQIVIAGDSAGGYLALVTAMNIQFWDGEVPGGLALMSPLMQLDPGPKKVDKNVDSDAMFAPNAFDAVASLIRKANGGELFEPLECLMPGLPPVLIHVSSSEVLLHDAELAAKKLTDVGVSVSLRVWPGQIHVFQIAAPLVPEAERSLKQLGAFAVLATAPKEDEIGAGKSLTERTETVS